MPMISLPVMWIIILDVAAWGFFHMLISILCFRIPLRFFQRPSSYFTIAAWEDSGQLWQRLLRVKKWKSHLPDGASLFRFGYKKTALPGLDHANLQLFADETKRAELTHALSMLPAPLFFIWNPIWAGWVMIGYALAFNLPFIIVQRYNRARLQVLLDRRESHHR